MTPVITPSAPVADATSNPCRLCAPLGACLAYLGVRGCVPFLHGGQGCATYMRRHLIGHFREPVDIVCANFDESAAVFGGERHFRTGLANVQRQFDPELVGVATTCLAETIGEDLGRLEKVAANDTALPEAVCTATPSYAAGHDQGFRAAEERVVRHLADPDAAPADLALLPGMMSPADLRALRALAGACGREAIIPCDYADALDGGTWTGPDRPRSGTPRQAIAACGNAALAVAFARTRPPRQPDALDHLASLGVSTERIGVPVGVRATDRLVDLLLQGRPMPAALDAERARLIDAYADGHKFVSGKRVLICADPDLALALAGFAWEVGLVPAVVATGGNGGRLVAELDALRPDGADAPTVLLSADYADCAAAASAIDLIIGPSRSYHLARSLDRPLVRLGFPVSDRLGAARIRCCGYDGTQALFDTCVNALIAHSQDHSPVGYLTY